MWVHNLNTIMKNALMLCIFKNIQTTMRLLATTECTVSVKRRKIAKMLPLKRSTTRNFSYLKKLNKSPNVDHAANHGQESIGCETHITGFRTHNLRISGMIKSTSPQLTTVMILDRYLKNHFRIVYSVVDICTWCCWFCWGNEKWTPSIIQIYVCLRVLRVIYKWF